MEKITHMVSDRFSMYLISFTCKFRLPFVFLKSSSLFYFFIFIFWSF